MTDKETHQNHISRYLLSLVLLLWAAFCVAAATNSASISLSMLLRVSYGLPLWVTSLFYFGLGAIFSWASLSCLLSKNWDQERFQTITLTMSTAFGVAIGFAGLTPYSAFWHFSAQIGILVALAATAIAAALLLAISSKHNGNKKIWQGSNDNYRMPGRRTASNAQEVAAFQTLKDGWLR